METLPSHVFCRKDIPRFASFFLFSVFCYCSYALCLLQISPAALWELAAYTEAWDHGRRRRTEMLASQGWVFIRGRCTKWPVSGDLVLAGDAHTQTFSGTHEQAHVHTHMHTHVQREGPAGPAQLTPIEASPHHLRAEKSQASQSLNCYSTKRAEMLL